MAAISSKFLDAFRRLSWSDKRKQNNLNTETTEEGGDVHSESTNRENDNEEEINLDDLDPNASVNMSQFDEIKHMTTFAKGNVVNIVNSSQVHWGPLHITYNNNGPYDQRKNNQHWTTNNMNVPNASDRTEKQSENQRTRKRQNTSTSSQSAQNAKNESVPCTSRTQNKSHKSYKEIPDEVELLMKSTTEPTHKHIRLIAKNLGRDWHEVFIALGFKMTTIENFEIDACRAGYGIREARYQLLLDWIRGESDATLGRLTSKLWEVGEISIVEELADLHKQEEEDSLSVS